MFGALATGAFLVSTAWNLLTDWVWIGGALGVMPEADKNDIQKRALSIKQLLDAPRSLIYTAEKQKRSISQQERQLIQVSVDEAVKQIKDLDKVYSEKFILMKRNDVLTQLRSTVDTLKIEVNILRQMAGLVPRAPLQKNIVESDVEIVYDGDTLKLANGETVRFVGIDAPESTTPAGEVSKAYLKKRLSGQHVRVESDPDHLADMYGRRLGVVYLKDTNINVEMLQKGLAEFYQFEDNALVFKKQWKAAADIKTAAQPTAAIPRVFTGVVSQQAIGNAIPFTPRQDDLIENIDELKAAAENNEKPFLDSLPGRIIREIKIVPSITTKSGLKVRGGAQQIVSGYLKDGTPKYKTVFNKYAVADMYLMNEKGTRTKIQQIVYGPVDSGKFHPEETEVAALAAELQQPVSSEAPSAATSAAIPPIVKISVTPRDYYVWDDPFWGHIYYRENGRVIESPDLTSIFTEAELVQFSPYGSQLSEAKNRLITMGYPLNTLRKERFPKEIDGKPAQIISTNSFEEFYGASVSITQPPANASLPAAALAANTLYEFYTAQGLPISPRSTRAMLYEKFGLGKAALYVGTAEQNIKLLAALQGKI